MRFVVTNDKFSGHWVVDDLKLNCIVNAFYLPNHAYDLAEKLNRNEININKTD